jgi:hypothetical protein
VWGVVVVVVWLVVVECRRMVVAGWVGGGVEDKIVSVVGCVCLLPACSLSVIRVVGELRLLEALDLLDMHDLLLLFGLPDNRRQDIKHGQFISQKTRVTHLPQPETILARQSIGSWPCIISPINHRRISLVCAIVYQTVHRSVGLTVRCHCHLLIHNNANITAIVSHMSEKL